MPVLQLELSELSCPEPLSVGLGVEGGGDIFVGECEEVEREAEARHGHAGDQSHAKTWERCE